jgi:hypothetical protein
MANRRFIDFPIAASVGDNDIVLIWQDGLNKQTTKATLFAGSPNSLAGLTDVDISALANGQILQYNSTTSKWENVDRTDIDLDQLGDVTIVSPTNGQVLVYNSSTSKWENSSAGFVPYTGAVTTVDLGAQSILAGSFVKAGGTSAQFLKADGSVDSNTYLTTGSAAATYVPYTGATADVNLGTHDLTAERGTFANNGSSDTLTVNHTSGSGYGIIVTKGGNNEALYVSKTSGSGNAMTVIGGDFQAGPAKFGGTVRPTTNLGADLGSGSIRWSTLFGRNIDLTEGAIIAGTLSTTSDAVINGVNVGKGGGSLATNTMLGTGALSFNTTGSSNTSAGFQSLQFNTTGSSNTSVGINSLNKNTSGSSNTSVGNNSLIENTTGFANTAIGSNAGRYISDGTTSNSTANTSIFIGVDSKALANNQSNQIVIGNNSIGNGTHTVTIGNSFITDNYFTGNIRGGAFIKSGGTSAQFLKADGSVDSTSYGAGTVTSVAALTLGTSGTDLSSTVANGTTTPVITLNVPTASATNRGALSSADWTTFNGKQNALTNPVIGTGGSGQVAYFTGTSAISSGSNFAFNSSESNLTIQRATTTLGNALTISKLSDSDQAWLAFRQGGGASGTWRLGYTGGVYDFRINAGSDASIGTQALRIFQSSQNVVIGTATSDAGFKLDVNGTGRFNANGSIFGTNSAAGTGLNIQAGNGASTLVLIGRDNSGIDDNFVAFRKFDGTTLQAAFYVRSNIFSIRDATNTDVFTIQAGASTFSGDLIINSLNPITYCNATSNNRASGIITQESGTSKWGIGANFGTGDNSFNVYNYGLGSRSLTITSAGNVLINTGTSGASKLRIVGLPTSAAGLSSGDVYNLAGVLMIA